MKTEEKGMDVNLASILLSDCFDNNYDDAIVISNDADLTKPVELVTQHYGKKVLVVKIHIDVHILATNWREQPYNTSHKSMSVCISDANSLFH